MDVPITPALDYRLTAPLAEETLAKLYQAVGSDRAEEIWSKSCVASGRQIQGPYTIDDLIALGMELKKTPGISGVYGCSMEVRARSFRTLQNLRSAHKYPY